MNNDIVAGFNDGAPEHLSLRLQRIEEVAGGLLLHALGTLDTYSADYFLKACTKAVEAGFGNLVIDMREVPYASSAGIAALATLLRRARGGRGNVVLQNPQPSVRQVMELLGLCSFFCITLSLAQSIDILAPAGPRSRFPRIFTCPACGKRLRAVLSGRFRCTGCRSILVVDPAAAVSVR